jgi:hypothetical protein
VISFFEHLIVRDYWVIFTVTWRKECSIFFSEYAMAKESHSISHSCWGFLKIWRWLTVSRYSLRFYGVSRSPSLDTTHSVGLLCMSDQPVAETSTWRHTTKETSIDASGGFRNYNPSKRAAADPRLGTRDQFLAIQIYLLECAGIRM